MPLTFPTQEQVQDRARTDVRNSLPESNPFLSNSWISALIFSYAAAVHDAYIQQELLTKELFPNTSTDEFLARWASIFGLSRNPATKSSGLITVTGSPGSSIPLSSLLQSDNGIAYTTTSIKTIESSSISVVSLERSGNTATATTSSAHILASGIDATISGADQSEYNGTFEVSVLSESQFSYTVPGTPVTPATGTILASFDGSSIPVDSTTFGQETNQIGGAVVTFASPIAGIDNSAIVQFNQLSGGTDIESDQDFRSRLLTRIQKPVANFNPAAIINKAREVAGVTRVFVNKVTPEVGQVTIYFLRDDDLNIIPDANEVQEVRDAINNDDDTGIYPAHSSDVDLFVLAPTPVTIDFSFIAVNPNTTSMHNAIMANLKEFFRESTVVSEDVLQLAYDSVIFNTIDPETGQKVISFSLGSPAGDVLIDIGEIGILGSINFS